MGGRCGLTDEEGGRGIWTLLLHGGQSGGQTKTVVFTSPSDLERVLVAPLPFCGAWVFYSLVSPLNCSPFLCPPPPPASLGQINLLRVLQDDPSPLHLVASVLGRGRSLHLCVSFSFAVLCMVSVASVMQKLFSRPSVAAEIDVDLLWPQEEPRAN